MLKRKYVAQSDIPERDRDHYALTEDGKWTLQVEADLQAAPKTRKAIGDRTARAHFIRENGLQRFLDLPPRLRCAPRSGWPS